jgi:hypothetical protein
MPNKACTVSIVVAVVSPDVSILRCEYRRNRYVIESLAESATCKLRFLFSSKALTVGKRASLEAVAVVFD